MSYSLDQLLLELKHCWYGRGTDKYDMRKSVNQLPDAFILNASIDRFEMMSHNLDQLFLGVKYGFVVVIQ